MTERQVTTIDGNEAAAYVAYRVNEVCTIYPITPSSTMAELADQWASEGVKNIWGTIPLVMEMQSEGGAAGAAHGALQTGSLTTTFTASQGLMLMIPNMYKIAGELTSAVFHVAARSLATQGLSIFGDHQDVMAVRATGFCLLASGSVQEAHDMALIAQAATLEARVPFIHFFDGFRTSHEVNKLTLLTDDEIRAMIRDDLVLAHRARALNPDRPFIRGTAQNPDVYFQSRETVNPFYAKVPGIVQAAMDKFAGITGRRYHLFDYFGDPLAERVVILMGSGAETACETADYLNQRGERVGVIQVRLYQPLSASHFLAMLPASVKSIAVLDRTKEPGTSGEPMYLEVVNTLMEAHNAGTLPTQTLPRIIGGRYGLSSKEFTPAMCKAVFDELSKASPKNHFTVGINDDVMHTSLDVDPHFMIESDKVVRAMFYGLGADGTVGANKNSIKIIGEQTPFHAQGYFVYDSKKSGAMTISHLRFGPREIRAPYLIRQANFVGVHQWEFLDKYDIASYCAPSGTVLLNAAGTPSEVWARLPQEAQMAFLEKKVSIYVIDAYKVARESGMGGRINTIMQTCFFAISGVLPREEAIAQIKKAIEKTYAKKGAEVVQKNFAAVDQTLSALNKVPMEAVNSSHRIAPPVPAEAPDFVQRVTGVMLANLGDRLPVSAFPPDGTWPVATTQWEKRNIAQEIPVWDNSLCIQCNKCVLVCPHATIRSKFYPEAAVAESPSTFKSTAFRSNDFKGMRFTIQVAPEDCTGCTLCVQVCPAKDKANPKRKALNMAPQQPLRVDERDNWNFFQKLPMPPRVIKPEVKASQFLEPLFEFSGACTGCGETPYIKLLTQLYGDRAYIANATGCSSIYGGNLPTTPYCTNAEGRGPAWSNSLFEDNAEYGLGQRVAVDKLTEHAKELVAALAPQIGEALVDEILGADQSQETGIFEQRKRVVALKESLRSLTDSRAGRLLTLADFLVRKSVWIVGGDGWAYDIGYGGLDHVLSMSYDVNILVLDTEVYSNTGGQQSKSTPMGASAKFAVAGKTSPKKDLALLATSYGHVYVARVAFGAKDAQTVQAFQEAESYPGPSLILAYSHCIAHGYGLELGLSQQKLAVECGHWPLFRFDPRLGANGQNPWKLDSAEPKIPLSQYLANEIRYRMLEKTAPERAKEMQANAQDYIREHYKLYQKLAASPTSTTE
ncbi:MAG TPA: pyruvate:ferredoxin (flavodoxin) oxidoreductase [Verrucomicrobia bacterium]|nr:pyruvate:ferredoxin (flavodoxin) oxidoreductase [Verrucomicrobiota bacterium]